MDIRADIYSLGCTLFHLLTGKTPFGQGRSLTEVMHAHLNDPLPGLTQFRPDAPPELDELLKRMTAKDREDRCSTPQQVAKAIDPFCRCSDLEKLVPLANPSPPLPRPVKQDSRLKTEQKLRKRWMAVSAVLATLLIVAIAFVLIQSRAEGPVERNLPPTKDGEWRLMPVAIAMDTTYEKGAYPDADNKGKGGSNAQTIAKLLSRLMPAMSVYAESIGSGWSREEFISHEAPDILLAHRSLFFHVAAAETGEPYPPDPDDPQREQWSKAQIEQWERKYERMGDDKLRGFLGYLGARVSRTQIIIYSRGTDRRWEDAKFRAEWVASLEAQYPHLKGRARTMIIPNRKRGTFSDAETQQLLINLIKERLILVPRLRYSPQE